MGEKEKKQTQVIGTFPLAEVIRFRVSPKNTAIPNCPNKHYSLDGTQFGLEIRSDLQGPALCNRKKRKKPSLNLRQVQALHLFPPVPGRRVKERDVSAGGEKEGETYHSR